MNFPFKDFDPTPYLASVPQETILRHKEISDNLHDNIDKNERHPKMCNIDCDEQTNKNTANNQINNNLQEASIPSSSSQINNRINEKDIIENNFRTYLTEDDENIEEDDDVDSLQDDGENRNSINDLPVLSPTKETTLERRKRLISTSLTKTPVIDGEFTDFHNHILNEGEDPFNLKYQLYAVVVSIFLFMLIYLSRLTVVSPIIFWHNALVQNQFVLFSLVFVSPRDQEVSQWHIFAILTHF